MKLKESTFAIIAEKKDSISHKWFNALDQRPHAFEWGLKYYVLQGGQLWGQDSKPENMPIYTESEFESLLKAEQENEAKEITKEFKDKFTGGVNEVYEASREAFPVLTEMPTWSKTVGFQQPKVIISYQNAIDLLAYYTKIDKGIIKIEMP